MRGHDLFAAEANLSSTAETLQRLQAGKGEELSCVELRLA
jgi:hypothetical protein